MVVCRRRKQWTCLVLMVGGVVTVQYALMGRTRPDPTPQTLVSELRGLRPGPEGQSPEVQAPQGLLSKGHLSKGHLFEGQPPPPVPVLTLHPPSNSTADLGQRVGLSGLQTYDCARALRGVPVSRPAEGPPVIQVLADSAFSQLLGDCAAFVARHGYSRHPPVTQEERAFPLAFNILLYKEVQQVHVLLRAVYRPHNQYCLHVDGLAHPQVLEATRRLAACLPNVFLSSRRENITYSGFSRLQADLNCMQDHWDRSNSSSRGTKESSPQWQYLINLPSQDFPLKTNLELVQILKIYNGANDIEGITQSRRMLKQRFTFKHVYVPDGSSGRLRIVRTSERHEAPPLNITVVKGSAYGVFSRQFVHYVLHDPRARALLRWCRAVDSPDEYFWATLNHNNPHLQVPGAYTGVPDQKPWLAVYASWPPRDPCGSGKVVRGVCIFGERDLPQLLARRELFANKFYLHFQPQTLHCLDLWLLHKTRAAAPLLNASYYRQLPFVYRESPPPDGLEHG